ncbi:CAAX amino terminal protease family protein [Methanosarcina siciliae C2J]|uniref:CAAX amino terminal protease family protein n=1 Tax=Methanosarcina siciliae C2J TaxID=1434118 RepID=A0A0E3LEC8_9EURY|nr:type II CAAX endopeptidase family protein [Methanosarcina siciliae]AKB38796.1 CAAX amino terminal protease family protein [Methanosarcina siciliae C2J]
MQKIINSPKKQKELNFLIIVSVLILALLVISPEATANSNPEFSGSPEMGSVSEQAHTKNQEETGDSEDILTSYEKPETLQKISQYINMIYTAGGIGAVALFLLAYLRTTSGDSGLAKNPVGNSLRYLNPLKILKTEGSEKTDQEKLEARKLRFLTAVPVLSITLAELLIFSGRMGAAVWIHICTLIALSLSNIVLKDPEIHKIYQAFMLLPVLRLINLSMPIFFDTTLYTFIFIYGPLAIPVVVIVLHQRDSLEQMGITLKHVVPYMFLSVPLGFVIGLGEYLTIKTGYLIPDLTFTNMFKLIIVMVFFVGLIEELIFRSILQTRLKNALGMWEALLITSFMFGLMHSGYGTIQEILYTGFVGFIMGLAFYKTKSLPFIAVLHGFVNVFLFGILPHQLSLWPGF